jgi:hypothetical protein
MHTSGSFARSKAGKADSWSLSFYFFYNELQRNDYKGFYILKKIEILDIILNEMKSNSSNTDLLKKHNSI